MLDSSLRVEIIKKYRTNVLSANKEATKKELFKDLLNDLYHGIPEIKDIIKKISLGAEAAVINIPRKDKVHIGSADTLYNKIIIEFENDLKKTGKHAKEQLAGYLLGKLNSGEDYNYTLIATDCISWKIYSLDISQLDSLQVLTEDEVILNEVISASIVLKENNTEDFFYWIDRFLFREEKQRATLKKIEESFGQYSSVFIESLRELSRVFDMNNSDPGINVSYEQWGKFLAIAYGKFDASKQNFLIHTYLSIFSKILAYVVISNDDYIDEDELSGIIKGNIFKKFNIANFIDNDFFHWITKDKTYKNLIKVFRLISQEISSYNFDKVDEDILKGVYQALIDLDTRHSLGEYYTPDWLCKRILKEFTFKRTDRILDPACGSGSFLLATVHKIQNDISDITTEELLENIHGIDIHPLSVQITKTTLLLALGREFKKVKKPIHLNITLANTLLSPEGVNNLFSDKEFNISIDKKNLGLDKKLLNDVNLFDLAVEICDDLAEKTLRTDSEPLSTFKNILQRRSGIHNIDKNVLNSFYQIYESLKSTKESGRDSIWKFIVMNSYKPYFLKDKFDYVVGNPPWFTMSSIKNIEYQNNLKSLADEYKVTPEKKKNAPHLEIATIFLSFCSSYFLRNGGKISFVLPRSIFNANHHENLRLASSKGFKLSCIWDLNNVSPLFRIPSCVVFANKENFDRSYPAEGLPSKIFSGRLKIMNCSYDMAVTKLIERECVLFRIKQGEFTALTENSTKRVEKNNIYKDYFKQGATIVPRSFYFVKLDQETPEDWNDRILSIKTDEDIIRDAKKPWQSIKLEGQIESEFLFRTALAKNIVPFGLFRPPLVVLPILIKNNEMGKKVIRLQTTASLLKSGFLEAHRWFATASEYWETRKSEKSESMSINQRLDFQKGLCDQNLNVPYIVLYNSSAKDANATVVSREELVPEFIVDHKAYVYHTVDKKEAYYLAAILNSSTPNELMKDFQTMGLFGHRDIHKRILDVYFPKYNTNDPNHVNIANLSNEIHRKVSNYLASIPEDVVIEGMKLGKLRIDIKSYIASDLLLIDELVKKIMSSSVKTN
ncbi:MAG TPA: N-6 DNA methylase [Lentimicrobium sp.]|nr:N-6 DNA methylase [Lentimicrobium sp.]